MELVWLFSPNLKKKKKKRRRSWTREWLVVNLSTVEESWNRGQPSLYPTIQDKCLARYDMRPYIIMLMMSSFPLPSITFAGGSHLHASRSVFLSNWFCTDPWKRKRTRIHMWGRHGESIVATRLHGKRGMIFFFFCCGSNNAKERSVLIVEEELYLIWQGSSQQRKYCSCRIWIEILMLVWARTGMAKLGIGLDRPKISM